jgi:hypothetical protein
MIGVSRRPAVGAAAALAVLAAAGCTAAPGSTGGSHADARRTNVPPAGCEQAPRPSAAGPEIHGRSSADVSLYGLVFHHYPVPAGQVIKIAWRMTGSGSPRFTAVGPSGTRIRPAWGPERHGGSTWRRPGQEWGTGFRFPDAGCWTVRVKRGPAVAVAGVLVTEG